MTPASTLGFRSELIFHRHDGEVIDCRAQHGCQVIRTPSNPTYYWGNYLLFDAAPRAGDVRRWPALFEELIAARQPLSTHRAFGWMEDSAGDVASFLDAGYTRNDATVMQRRGVPHVPSPAVAAELRPLARTGAAAEREWAALCELGLATRAPVHGEAEYRPFMQRRVAAWRGLADAGRGEWFGAFVAEDSGKSQLVAALGIYAEQHAEDGERIARYQSVMTDAAYRRRGLCRALIACAAAFAVDTLYANRLIIVAAAGEMPEQLYAGLGFAAAGLQRGLQKMPPQTLSV